MTAFRLCAFLAATLAPIASAAAPIDDARSAYRAYKVTEAEERYRAIAADPQASAKDRGQAETELARIAWLVDGNAPAATQRLARSMPANPEPCAAALLYARILNGERQAADVAARLGSYAAQCADIEPGVPVEIARSWVLSAAARPPKARAAPLEKARQALATMPALARAGLDAARLSLDIGLLAGDGQAALAGWRNYLWLAKTNQPTGFPETSDAIATAFAGAGRVGAHADAVSLAAILIRAGFAQEAAWLAADHALAASRDRRWPALAAYLTMRAKLETLVLAHDRHYARDPHEDGPAFERAILDVLRGGLAAAGQPAADDPWPALQRLWDLHGQTGDINGVAGIMAGHAVEDRASAVAQEGRQSSIRYVALDNMIENSFSAWLWDGSGGPGGWAHGGTLIYQVRPLYARGTLRALAVAAGGPARAKALADAEVASRSDETRVHDAALVALPGLGQRLRLQAIDQVAAHARQDGTGEAAFIAAFRRQWWDLDLQSSIILHEGRHVLDQIEYKDAAALSAPELEFRGKLSEIEYSDLPRGALAGIVGFEIDPASSHGQANRRIIKLYADWTTAHSGEVAGFDPARAPALQIDKLTDDQIRAIAAAADPERARVPK